MDTTGLDVNRIKQNVIEYWNAERWNWPFKVISMERGLKLGLVDGSKRLASVQGYITAEKFIRGRTLQAAERILGLKAGELKDGAVVLKLTSLPASSQFELRGYTNTPGGERYTGGAYPPGLGASQWELITSLPATVIKVVQSGELL